MTCQQQLHTVFSVFGQCCSPHPKDQSKPICEYLPRGRKAISFQLLLGQQMATVPPVIMQKGYVMLRGVEAALLNMPTVKSQSALAREVGWLAFALCENRLWPSVARPSKSTTWPPPVPAPPAGLQALHVMSDHIGLLSKLPQTPKRNLDACLPPNVNIPGTRI